MAKQTINQGTAPSGAGGDTFRSGSAKLQANDNELYNWIGNGSSVTTLPAALPVAKGGTGATTTAAARTNLGLGTAATATLTVSTTDATTGRVVRVGDFGIGTVSNNVGYHDLEKFANKKSIPTGFFRSVPTSVNSIFGSIAATLIHMHDGHWLQSLGFPTSKNASPVFVSGTSDGENGNFGVVHTFKTTQNTTIDSNGFIKSASPIVNLYADHIELNDEAKQQEITFEKLGTGDYLIKGSSGFAQEGWYVEQPKDANGNIYHAVVYEQLENGDISVKTYEKRITETGLIAADPNKPIDIKQDRFISIRLQELPTEEIEPEVDQTLLDDEGQPAPSHYHTLENGVWVISGEDAERLEQEQLAKMQPLTRRQFRLALAMNGYDLPQVEALIDQIPDPMQRQIALIEWQDATTFERLNPSLLAMADLMGLGAEQVNMLWNQALTL